MSGLSHTPDETTLRDILLRELRQSKRLKYDLVIYDRAREGAEQHTYRFLVDSLKELLTRERKRKNRDRIARSHGDKYGAAASKSPSRTATPSGRGGRGRSQSPRPRSPGRSKSHSPGKSRSLSPKGVCYDFLNRTCKRGNNCPFLHKKRYLSLLVTDPKRRSRKPVNSGRKGTAREVTSVGFNIRMLTSLLCQLKSEAAPAAPKAGSPTANSPAPTQRKKKSQG